MTESCPCCDTPAQATSEARVGVTVYTFQCPGCGCGWTVTTNDPTPAA